MGTKGSKVLILGGAGAVGTVACQLAKLRGAWVATTCSPRTKDYVIAKSNPDLIVDYTSQKWDEDVPQLKGIDAVFEAVADDGFARAKKIVTEGGSFAAIATLMPGLIRRHTNQRFSGRRLCASRMVKEQDELAALLADKKLTLDVEETFPFTSEGVQAAFAKQ